MVEKQIATRHQDTKRNAKLFNFNSSLRLGGELRELVRRIKESNHETQLIYITDLFYADAHNHRLRTKSGARHRLT
jgi:hypothetical protein